MDEYCLLACTSVCVRLCVWFPGRSYERARYRLIWTCDFKYGASHRGGGASSSTSDAGADAAGAPRTVVALSKLSVRWNWHGRGDVVVLRSPSDPAELITKRLIALEGDWVQRRDGAREMTQVPRGHVWVEGDNARFSKDSNAFGAVPAGLIESQVVATLWPPAEAGRVIRVEPPRERVIEGRRPFIRDPRF